MRWIKLAPGWHETEDGRGLCCCSSIRDETPYFTLHWRPGRHRRIWQEVYSPTGRCTFRRSLAAAQRAVEAKLAAVDARIERKAAA